MKDFLDSDRYEFPLRAESVIVDVGAFHGNWALEMHKRYGCTILAFEPVKRFYDIASKTLEDCPNAVLFHAGLGPKFARTEFGIQNDSTGEFSTSQERERVTILPFMDTLNGTGMTQFDLLKLNCEGGEYGILEQILERGAAKQFKHILFQCHTCAPDWGARYTAIAKGLEATHELEGRVPFVWERWRSRT